jgi:hypothetical protein
LPNNQAQLDPVVEGVIARGMQPSLVLYGTVQPATAGTPADVMTFARTQAAKWKGKVRVFELFNEPDMQGWTPQTYTTYLKAAYSGLKQGSPDAVLSTGGIWKWPSGPAGGLGQGMVEWVRQMYQAGAKGSFDAVALHLYEDPFVRGDWNPWDWAFLKNPSVRSVMDSYGDQKIPIWSSENGGNVGRHGGESGQQALVANQIKALGAYPVAAITTYAMFDDTLNANGDGWGLLRMDRSRRPAWYAYQQAAPK